MSTIPILPSLIGWNAWANRQVFETVRASGGEPAKALAAFQHIFETETVWLRRFAADPRPMLTLWAPASLETCEALALEAAALWASALTSLGTPPGLDREFTYRNSAGREFTDRVQEPLFQVLMHSSHYRGEASGFLNASGFRVPELDYILWIRLGSPE